MNNLLRKCAFALLLVLVVQPTMAEGWLFPSVKFSSLISSEKDYDKIQIAEKAVWDNSSKDYLCRYVIPMIDKDSKEIMIYALLRQKDGSFHREMVYLKINQKGKWFVSERASVGIAAVKALRCYDLFKKHMMSVRFSETGMGYAPDVSIVHWECKLTDKKGPFLQALQYSQPKADTDKSDLKEINDVILGE